MPPKIYKDVVMALHREYEALFEDYLRELKRARDDALRREEGRFKTWTERLGSEARAREKINQQSPACTSPRVIAVVRKYWLLCIHLNQKYPSQSVDPPEFLVNWVRFRSPEIAKFVSELPYWPMGKDEEGNWV